MTGARPPAGRSSVEKPRSAGSGSQRGAGVKAAASGAAGRRASTDRPKTGAPTGRRSSAVRSGASDAGAQRTGRSSTGPRRSAAGGSGRSDASSRVKTERSAGRQAPWVSEDITGEELDRQTINELRTLPDGLALATARHLVAIEQALEDEDYSTARAHSDYVRKHAGRVAAVREACAIVHYAAGDFTQALADFRAVSRMRGGNSYVPIMADCERGLGRPQRAVELLRAFEGPQPRGGQGSDASTRVEGLIVLAGARSDMGQADAAVLTLKVPELTRLPAGTDRARLQYAYADALLRVGRSTEAQEWMERAAGSDLNGATDAEERCLELAALNQ